VSTPCVTAMNRIPWSSRVRMLLRQSKENGSPLILAAYVLSPGGRSFRLPASQRVNEQRRVAPGLKADQDAIQNRSTSTHK
jgi:hypothetical protein